MKLIVKKDKCLICGKYITTKISKRLLCLMCGLNNPEPLNQLKLNFFGKVNK